MSLQLGAVSLSYPDGDDGRVQAVSEFSLAVAPGEVVALTGPSGCGKSSVLAVAGTLIRPDSGAVEIAGLSVGELSERERAAVRRDHVGFVFQRDNLLPDLTVLEQLLLTAHLCGERPSRHRDEARALLADVGLDGRLDALPRQLSGGMRQRVNIARALMGPKQVLLVDEPTAALDSERSHSIIELIVRLVRERELAALLVTHDLDALRLGQQNGVARLARMRDGRLVEQ